MLIVSKICVGQNLVPNGDFEQYSMCPEILTELWKAQNWMNPATNQLGTGTPDYYNSCSTGQSVDIPNNNFGTQEAHSDSGYCGIQLYSHFQHNSREYIESHLTVTLQKDSCYHFKMYVNLGDWCKYATNDIQVYFSDSAINGVTNGLPLPFIPQLNNISTIMFDSQNWRLVDGDYIALGTENYLLIGNFKNDTLTSLDTTTAWISNESYVYIDDVSLTQFSCFTDDISEIQNNSLISISPNPCNACEVRGAENATDLTVTDILERKVNVLFTESVSGYYINMPADCNGIYLLRNNKTGEVVKFVKE